MGHTEAVGVIFEGLEGRGGAQAVAQSGRGAHGSCGCDLLRPGGRGVRGGRMVACQPWVCFSKAWREGGEGATYGCMPAVGVFF